MDQAIQAVRVAYRASEEGCPVAALSMSLCGFRACVSGWQTRWQTAPDQNIRTEVRAVRPDHGAPFHTHLAETSLIAPDPGENRSAYIGPRSRSITRPSASYSSGAIGSRWEPNRAIALPGSSPVCLSR
jgi:hypothetical protein